MPGTEWVAPTITGAIALVTALIAGGVAIRNVRNGARENRAPSVVEAWGTADRVRDVWYDLVDLFHEVRGGWKGYARRVQAGGSTELTAKEKALLEKRPPSIDKE